MVRGKIEINLVNKINTHPIDFSDYCIIIKDARMNHNEIVE